MFQAAEFAVGRTQDGAFELHVMFEWRGREQLDAPVAVEHVSEVQTQLGVAAHGGLATQIGACQRALIDFDVGAVGFRVDGDCTGTKEDVAGFVGVGERGCEREGKQRGAEQGLVHGGSRGR